MIADLATQHALDRYHQLGIPGLNDEETTLAAIWCFESKVANGGLERFFKSKEGDFARLAPTAFRRVGAEALATIAERANAVFGPDGIPSNKTLRGDYLDSLPASDLHVFDELEAQYAEYGIDLDERVETYLARRRQGGM